MPQSAREREEQAVLLAHDLKKQQRERERIERLRTMTVLKLRGSFAMKGKKPTRAEENAAAAAAVHADQAARDSAKTAAEDDKNGVPAHRRIR